MRKYEEKKENQVVEVYCNCCGKKLNVKDGVIMEGSACDGFLGIFFQRKMGNIITLTCVKVAMTNGLQAFRFRWKRKWKMKCCSTKKTVL